MAAYILQRLLISVPVLLGVLLIGFLLLQVVPSDPVELLAGPEATQEVRDSIRRDLGLDQPLYVQFGSYLIRVLQGDLGRSLISNRSVANNTFDLYLLAIFGLLGFALAKLGFEAGPLVLGYVLGPLLEENFRRALSLANGDGSVFLTRPISAGVLAVALLLLVITVLPAVRRQRDSAFQE